MKLVKRILTVLLVTVLLLLGIFCMGRYGWKILGFRACQGAWTETIEVRENGVHIQGGYPGSFPNGFCGYIAKQEGQTLYVGFHFSGIFGFFETGDFDITIPTKGEIREIILKTKNHEFSIWTAEEEQEAVK